MHPTPDRAGNPLGRRRARAQHAAFVLAVLLVAACGGGGGEVEVGAGSTPAEPAPTTIVDTTTPASTQVTPTTGRTPQTPRTGPLTTPPSVRPADAYLPAGVRDQIFPPNTNAFEMLARGECGPLLREIKEKWSGMPPSLTLLYRAAGQVCLSKWREAEADHKRIDLTKICNKDDENNSGWDSSFATQEDCIAVRMQVYKWTSAMLAARRANPRFVPNFSPPPTP